MRVALIGEFSGVHTNLKVGLEGLGHHVAMISDGDGFKGFSADRRLGPSRPGRLALAEHLLIQQPRLLAELTRDYDVIQFMHPESVTLPVHARGTYAKWLLSSLDSFRGVVSMVVAGCDPYVLPLMARSEFSPCAGCLQDSGRVTCTYDFETKSRRQVAEALSERADVIVPFASAEYGGAYGDLGGKNIEPLNFPVAFSGLSPVNQRAGRLRVMHGITRPGFKGTETILSSIQSLATRYPELYEVVIVERLPFEEYLRLLPTVNVVVDQIFGSGLGMNALFTMAQGRVLLTSFDRNFASGDVDYRNAPVHDISKGASAISSALEAIQHWSSDELAAAGVSARQYVESHCSPTEIAKQVSAAWSRAASGRLRGVDSRWIGA